VEPHPPGETLPENGLPVFSLNYANDDDQLRQLGSDARLTFIAPADGAYLVRVTDARNFGGARFTYRLLVREARPEFTVAVEGFNPSIPQGSGRGFAVRVNRIDGFDGPVKVDFAGAASPFVISSPLIIEAGHVEAQGTVFLPAQPPTTQPIQAGPLKATASAAVAGKEISKPLPDLPKLAAAGKPILTVS